MTPFHQTTSAPLRRTEARHILSKPAENAGDAIETARLTTSDGRACWFGTPASVNLSGSRGLFGARGDASHPGAAYLFHDLDTATGTIIETARLTAFDGSVDKNDFFGASVSQSGSNGLVGAYGNDGFRGAAYLFLHLDAAAGEVSESVKLIASGACQNFGSSVSLDGDRFLIEAGREGIADSGKVCTGRVSAITTLDAGNANRNIDGVSFISRTDWIVGRTTDENQVILNRGDTAIVTAAGKAVYIGQSAGSNANTLRIDGTLAANEVYIGSLAGNIGNTLRLESTSAVSAIAFRLAPGNFLSLEGDCTGITRLLDRLGATELQVWNGRLWETVNADNSASLISESYASGTTTVGAVPEPSSWSLLVAGANLDALRLFRNRHARA